MCFLVLIILIDYIGYCVYLISLDSGYSCHIILQWRTSHLHAGNAFVSQCEAITLSESASVEGSQFAPKQSLPRVKWKSFSHVLLFAIDGLYSHGILQAGILEWVAFPFSRESYQPRDQTQVSCTAGGFFTSWATREAQECWSA